MFGPTPADGALSFAVPEPRRVYTHRHYEIWHSTLPGRNGGVAVAVYDRQTQHHTWVLTTAGCRPESDRAAILATDIVWSGRGETMLTGEARSRHGVYEVGDGTIVLDLLRSTAHRVVPTRRALLR